MKKFRIPILIAAAAVLAAMMVIQALPAPKAPAPSTFTRHTFKDLSYMLFVPGSYSDDRAMPLVVMLHGRNGSAQGLAEYTQMNALAEKEGFLVLYPEQSEARNSAMCWNWFSRAHQARGSGEPALIAGMVEEVREGYHIDGGKIFVSGLSAGGAMTAILGAAYPDVFRAIAIGSGLEYGAAGNVLAAFAAMERGGADPVQCGRAAYTAMGERARVVPALIFHGTLDTVVVPKNGEQLVTQWLTTDDWADNGAADGSVSMVPASSQQVKKAGERPYTVTNYLDGNGSLCVQSYVVEDMGHVWSSAPDESAIIWDFFCSVS